jgi:hypothetical protein
MPNAHTDIRLVEQPAIGLFEDLGWDTVTAKHIPQLAPLPSPE